MVKPGFALTAGDVADVVALCRCWTVCRWRSSWPPPAAACSARGAAEADRRQSRRDRDGQQPVDGSGPWPGRSPGATTCWTLGPSASSHLGVFSSRFDLDAVDRVAGRRGRDPLDVIAHMVDVSLVQIVEGPDGEPMIWLLETIRRFARHRLRESGEYDDARMRHAHWSLDVATRSATCSTARCRWARWTGWTPSRRTSGPRWAWCFTPGDFNSDRLEIGLSLLRARCSRTGSASRLRSRGPQVARPGAAGDGDLRGHRQRADRGHPARPGSHGPAAERRGSRLSVAAQALDMAYRIGDLSPAPAGNRTALGHRPDARRATSPRPERSSNRAPRAGAAKSATRSGGQGAVELWSHVHMDQGHYAAAVAAGREATATRLTRLAHPWGVAITEVQPILGTVQRRRAAPRAPTPGRDRRARRRSRRYRTQHHSGRSRGSVRAGLGDAPHARLLGAAENQRANVGNPSWRPDQGHLDRYLRPVHKSSARSDRDDEHRQANRSPSRP